MFDESLRYPRRGDEWVKTLLIGGVLTLFGFLLVPWLAVLGYGMGVLRATMAGDESPPAFEEWGAMVVDGFKASVVTFVYGIVPTVVVAVFGGLGLLGVVAGANADAGIGAVVGGLTAALGLLLGFVLALAAAYVIPAALANYAETDRVSAALDLGELRPVLTSGRYATAWATAAAIVVAAGLVSGALNVVPVIGFVAGAFVGFYAFVAAAHVVGATWGDLHPVEAREDTVDERPTA